jgi:transposase
VSFLTKGTADLKKKTYRSESVVTEQVQKQRLEFRQRINSVPENKLVFIDETACWVGMQRSQGRSLIGKKAYGLRKFYKGKKMTLIGAMNMKEVVATQMIEGSMKGGDFHRFIKTKLVPRLRRGQVVIMDNLRAHKMEGIEQLIQAKGAEVIYLPPYSPDFNPIEMLWSVLKHMIRQFRSDTLDELKVLIEVGLSFLEKSFFKNWFTKCCYCIS